MAGLLYREDMDAVRERMTTWWNGGDIGRAAMQITAPREDELEDIPKLPVPEGCQSAGYTIKDLDFRVTWGRRCGLGSWHLGESVPTAGTCLAPNTLALYLGCEGTEAEGTVWAEKCIESPETARFEYDETNKYWRFTQAMVDAYRQHGAGTKWLISFPDLIEGLDTLAAMRGTQDVLTDLIERPEWVKDSLKKITDLYFVYYDQLYDLMKDEVGGSNFWAWAPGKMAKFQCDFSAMIGPEMFGEFMVPVLDEMTSRVDHCMFHWDGPGTICHHDHLLGLKNLDMLQWTPGAGQPGTTDPKWWPMYHKTFDAGKGMLVSAWNDLDELKSLRKEFGTKSKRFLINFMADNLDDAQRAMDLMEC
jgi:hypothetical protein